jgi:thioredoxin reductase (NADPH)
MFDTVIIGSGIAGVTAAVYARRAGISSIGLFEKGMIGGQIAYIDKIDNYPGIIPGTSGGSLIQCLTDHLKELSVEPVYDAVESIVSDNALFELRTASGSIYKSRSVICATGAAPRRLGLAAENSYVGKGVSYCAVCDGFFFRGKTVAVIGGGNSALEEALYLANIAQTVYIIHRRDEFRAFASVVEQVKAKPNINILWNCVVDDLSGDSTLDSLRLRNTGSGERSVISVNGVFVAIGYEPATSFLRGIVDLDESGFVVVDGAMATSHPGIFACGDCIRKDLKQLVTSAAEGAVSAMSCWNYLKS